MKASELWAVCFGDALFSVLPLGEVMARNREGLEVPADGERAERAKDFSPLLVLDVAVDLAGANARRLELEKLRFGHALCGRRAGGNADARDWEPQNTQKTQNACALNGENDEG